MKSAKDIKTWIFEQRDLALDEMTKLISKKLKTSGDINCAYRWLNRIEFINEEHKLIGRDND